MAESRDDGLKPDEVRELVADYLLGEVRLGANDRETALQSSFEIYVLDDVDEADHAGFQQFAAETYDQLTAKKRVDERDWPAVTDCDRLDQAIDALHTRGIVLWAVSPCCDTCTMSEFPDYVDQLAAEDSTLNDRLRGYAFFIDQNMNESLQESSEISVYLGYGPTADLGEDEYTAAAVAIGEEVCECLETAGLNVDWSRTFEKKIGLSLNWQRRIRDVQQ